MKVKNPLNLPYVPKIRFHGAMVLADWGETNVSCSRDYFDLKGPGSV